MLRDLTKRTAIAATIASGALSLLLAAPGSGDVAISCAYVEAGAPGPAGNVLRIDDDTTSVTHIYRRGDGIAVFNNAARNQPVCSGDAPTVLNVDRIEYVSSNGVPFIGYSGSEALAPGATAEPDGSEIEILVREDYRPEVLNVGGTAGADTMVAGQLGRHRVGMNLNSQADGSEQDADVILETADPARTVVRMIGRGGSDSLSTLGQPGFAGPLLADRLLLSGGPGDDVLFGGPGNDRLTGDVGDDILRSGQGRDHITIGPGSDVARAGKGADTVESRSDVGGIPADLGPDRIFAGAGNDHVNLERSPRGNLIHCGSGSRDSAIVNLGDRLTACEQTEVTPR